MKGSLRNKKQLEIIQEQDPQVKDSAEVHSFSGNKKEGRIVKKFNDYAQDEDGFENDGMYSESIESQLERPFEVAKNAINNHNIAVPLTAQQSATRSMDIEEQ